MFGIFRAVPDRHHDFFALIDIAKAIIKPTLGHITFDLTG